MYKLVVVGGKLRGQEFILKEGENILGAILVVIFILPSKVFRKNT